jgi:serine/threonine protein kinase
MEIMGPILDGLLEVHSKNLLHRDIKPENILINARNQPVLIDFGSARSSIGATMTMTSIVTHGYSPIEQYQTKGRMGPWTDIYALGAVMCRAMTEEKPPVAADRIVEDDFQWVSHQRLAGYSEGFLNAVDWALRVKSQERPQELESWKFALQDSFVEADPIQESPARRIETPNKGKGLDEMVQISNTSPTLQKSLEKPEIVTPKDSALSIESYQTRWWIFWACICILLVLFALFGGLQYLNLSLFSN